MARTAFDVMAKMVKTKENKEFAVLVGKAFLHEAEAGHRDAAIAFGRAFLLALGMKGPEQKQNRLSAVGKPRGEHLALAEN
jgi:hypothetical protein